VPLDHTIDKVAQKSLTLRTMKTIYLDTVTVADHRGKTAHLVSSGDFHVLVGINNTQQKLTVVCRNQLVQ
jgi:hypothetical protein